jgi:type IV pilus assembly protein PilB
LIDFIDKKFTDILLEKGLIGAEQLTAAITKSEQNREPLDKVLVDMRAAPKDEIMWARAEELGKIYVDLANRKIDQEIADIVPESIARRHKLICIGRVDKKITLAMADPTDIFALDEVRIRTGFTPEPVLSFVDDVERSATASGSRSSATPRTRSTSSANRKRFRTRSSSTRRWCGSRISSSRRRSRSRRQTSTSSRSKKRWWCAIASTACCAR